jgi:hypothetical protein
MIERLTTLSSPVRYALYVAVALAVLLVAVGMGAAVAVVVGWQSTAVTGGTIEASTPEGGKLETTGATQAPEETASEPPGDAENPEDTSPVASFVHRATNENSRGDYTYISDPSIDGDSNAIVLATPTPDQVGAGTYPHNTGVWYAAGSRKWAIFNQNLARVPEGATFEVIVPQESASFVHHTRLLNTAGNYTYIDNRLTNGEPDAVLSVTQNWNPGGGRGVYNNHPVGTLYDAKVDKWAIYNRDDAPIPERAAFNVSVSAGTS